MQGNMYVARLPAWPSAPVVFLIASTPWAVAAVQRCRLQLQQNRLDLLEVLVR